MREIKFRCWSPHNKEMYFAGEDNYHFTVMDGAIVYQNLYRADDMQSFCTHPEKERDKIFVMQYTGLKDKNGKEIYEGDIVDTGATRIKVIVWENGAFHVRVPNWQEKQNMPSHPLYFRVVSNDPCEVIGNIYENPELIKEQNVNNNL